MGRATTDARDMGNLIVKAVQNVCFLEEVEQKKKVTFLHSTTKHLINLVINTMSLKAVRHAKQRLAPDPRNLHWANGTWNNMLSHSHTCTRPTSYRTINL